MLFKDRSDAGRQLAEKLDGYKQDKPLILALPRGGVPVGYEVAQRLNAPLDTLVVRKIGMPGNLEFGVGAIASGGVLVLDTKTLNSLGIKREELGQIIEKEKQELKRRLTKYESDKWSNGVSTDTIILIDDGLATGVTAKAAIESAKITFKPRKLIFAAPVCAKSTADNLQSVIDELVCVSKPEDLTAIGEWYQDFPQTSDEEVLYYLNKANEYGNPSTRSPR